MKFKYILFFSIILPDLAWSSSQNIIRDNFLKEIGIYVQELLNDNTFKFFVLSLMLAFLFFTVVKEITYFIFNGFEFERVCETFLWCTFAFGLLNLYDSILTTIWNAGQAIADIMQEKAVGNKDPNFLTMWVDKTLGAILNEEISIWDSISVVIISALWTLISIILGFVMWLASLYSVFGYALSKIIGLLFIPFIILPGTRSFFDAWLRFFTGFMILGILLRISSILLAFLIKAQLSSVASFSTDWQIVSVVALSPSDNLLKDCISTGFVGIVFVTSSFSFASQLGAGIGSGAGGINKAISSISKYLTRKFF